jgi:hypothetical protein
VGGRHFVIFGGRNESGAGSSEFLLDKVRVGKALRDFRCTKGEWVRPVGIFVGRSESGAKSSGLYVHEVR